MQPITHIVTLPHNCYIKYLLLKRMFIYVHYNVTLAIPSAKIAITTTQIAAKAKRITINIHVTKREYVYLITNCCA